MGTHIECLYGLVLVLKARRVHNSGGSAPVSYSSFILFFCVEFNRFGWMHEVCKRPCGSVPSVAPLGDVREPPKEGYLRDRQPNCFVGGTSFQVHPSDERIAAVILEIADFMLEFSTLGHEEAADIPQFVHPRIPNEVHLGACVAQGRLCRSCCRTPCLDVVETPG